MRPVTTRQRDRWWTRWVPQPVYGLQELSELFTTHRAAALHRIATLGALQRVYSPNEGEQLGPGVSAEAARTLFRLADRVIVLNLLLEVPVEA